MPGEKGEWAIKMRRCLSMIQRLQAGPANRSELMQAVLDEVGSDAYDGVEGRNQVKRFENDLAGLRKELDCDIPRPGPDNVYTLHTSGIPLLNLPDDALAGLAYLLDAFDPKNIPNRQAVTRFLRLAAASLSPQAQSHLHHARRQMHLDLPAVDAEPIHAEVEEKIRQAITKRTIAFTYRSPRRADGSQRNHRVQPWDLVHDAEWGHVYLRGYCLNVSGAGSSWDMNRYVMYRLSYIVPGSVELLSQRLPPTPPPVTYAKLVYRLHPLIARNGVSQRFEGMTVTPQTDGYALVEAEVPQEHLFFAVRSLLRYGGNCQVLGDDEALRGMKEAVRNLTTLYADPQPPAK